MTVVTPPPLKVCVPTSTVGPAIVGGATIDPVDVYAYVPRKVLLEQPLSSALAVGAMASANAVMAVSVLAMVLRFMMISSSGRLVFPPSLIQTPPQVPAFTEYSTAKDATGAKERQRGKSVRC